MTRPEDAFLFNRFEGCASSREFWWHLGADNAAQWDRYPNVTDWRWVPGEKCLGLRQLDGADLVRDLVEMGGWLILGDSMTENHFFSLSCLMYPHVRATPIYDQNAGYDRAWPQNIYLSPNSPLILTLRFPPGFSIERTPLVTFRRVDLLLSEPELISLHASHYSDLYDADPAFRLFADDVPVWTLSPSYYMPIFTSPLPDANYAAMVVSTAGHWTTMKFLGYRDENRPGSGIAGVLDFFAVSMQWWASEVQRMLDLHRAAHPKTEDSRLVADRKVIVRAYQSGHTDCHNHRKPLDRYVPTEHNQWNWASIWEFNRVFKEITSKPAYPDIHFLSIDRPGTLRPDAHSTSDCLHVMAGAGVSEGWTHYIWHYLTRETSPGR